MTSKILQEFLAQYEKTSTRYGYASAIYSFLDFIFKYDREGHRVKDTDKEYYEGLAAQYFTEDRDYKADLIAFSKSSDRPTRTIRMYLSVINEFFKFNHIKLDDQDAKDIRIKTPKKFYRNKDAELDMDMIRTILHHSDVKMKALILFLLSSGTRINEALLIKRENLVKKGDLTQVLIDYDIEKKGFERYSYITPEAERALNEWMKIRTKYIQEKAISEDKRVDDGRVFPFTKSNASVMLVNILQRAGLYEVNDNTGRSTIHFHLFRSFFISNLKLKISAEIVELFVHSGKDIPAIYRKYNQTQTYENYKKGMEVLTTDTDPALKKKYTDSVNKISELEQKQGTNAESISTLIQTIHNLQFDNKILNQRVEELNNLWIEMNNEIIVLKIAVDKQAPPSTIVGVGKQSDYK